MVLKSKKKSRLVVPVAGAAVQYPVIRKVNGFDLQVNSSVCQRVEELVSMGATARYVAKMLGVAERDLKSAADVCPELALAIEHGSAKDEFDVAKALRTEALSGDVPALSLYLKAKHGWRDRDASGGGGASPITINISGLLGGSVLEHQP